VKAVNSNTRPEDQNGFVIGFVKELASRGRQWFRALDIACAGRNRTIDLDGSMLNEQERNGSLKRPELMQNI
jgi:hypothetical protein